MSDLPVLPFRNQRAFETWLSKNHATSRGVWIKTAKAKSGIPSINYAQALEVALCWGWIDGQSRRIDEDWYVQKFTPRAPRSMWSKINCGRAEALIASGQMKAAGLAEVDRAKSDGRWGRAYDSWCGAQVPEDLAAALGRNNRGHWRGDRQRCQAHARCGADDVESGESRCHWGIELTPTRCRPLSPVWVRSTSSRESASRSVLS